jgi:hypothetical protein
MPRRPATGSRRRRADVRRALLLRRRPVLGALVNERWRGGQHSTPVCGCCLSPLVKWCTDGIAAAPGLASDAQDNQKFLKSFPPGLNPLADSEMPCTLGVHASTVGKKYGMMFPPRS